MVPYNSFHPSSRKQGVAENHRSKYLLRRMKDCRDQLKSPQSIRQANRMLTMVLRLSVKALDDYSVNPVLLSSLLETINAFLTTTSHVTSSIMMEILEALRTFHLKLEMTRCRLDEVSSHLWLSALQLMIDRLPEKEVKRHARMVGLLLLDSRNILSIHDGRVISFWHQCLGFYMSVVMNHLKLARARLYVFLDVIDRLSDIPSNPFLLDELLASWGQLRLDHDIGTALLEDDAFEKLLVTTGRYFQEKEAIQFKHRKQWYEKLHVLLMQLIFWGWHSSVTTRNFFSRLTMQLDHLGLLDGNEMMMIKQSPFFDQRWSIFVQGQLIRSIRSLIERYESCGIQQGTETLMNRFLEEILLKISPQVLRDSTVRGDLFKILEWLLKGVWSWKEPILTTWFLIVHGVRDPQVSLQEFVDFLIRIHEQPFQSLIQGNKEYFNLKHEAVIALLNGIIKEQSLDQLTKVSLIAELLSNIDQIFPDNIRSRVMKDIRNWFVNRGELDATTKVLTLMCA